MNNLSAADRRAPPEREGISYPGEIDQFVAGLGARGWAPRQARDGGKPASAT